jgi:Bacteriophage tail sheath protein
MPVALSYPGVYIEEVPSGVRTIAGVATSIGLFIGWAARGPTDAATRIFSFADYERTYGGLDLRTPLGYAVRHFFDNGGSDAYVIRIAPVAGEGGTGPTPPGAAIIASGDLQFTAASPGEWANQYRLRISPRTDTGFTDRFKLEVLGHPTQDIVVESYENLSINAADSRFVESMVNGRSQITRVRATGTTAPSGSPVTVKFADSTPPATDGTVLTPAAQEFHDAVLALFAVGGIADKLDLFNLVCVPGETHTATIQSLQAICVKKRAFLIVDCSESASFTSVAGEATPKMAGEAASYSGFYFPWVLAPDPLQSGAVRGFPPCGYVAGIMARTDARRGVWKAPAGTDAALTGAVGFTEPLSDAQNGVLNLQAINCLRTLPVYGSVVWGARTMAGDNNRGSEWKYVPVRRMALFLEESLFRGTQWVVFEPNDEPLWSQIRLNIGAFMQTLFRQGAFQGATPREAYFVKCDRTTTTQADINMGIVNIHVGFAPLRPAEFVVIRIQQIAGEITT